MTTPDKEEVEKAIEALNEDQGNEHGTFLEQIAGWKGIPLARAFEIIEERLPYLKGRSNTKKDKKFQILKAAMDERFGDGWDLTSRQSKTTGNLDTFIIKKTKKSASSSASQEQEADQEQKTGIVEQHHPLNQILYGPPGTGKTWNTVNRALAITDNEPVDGYENKDRKDTKKQFDKLKEAGQIEMVTFHQNYTYEDFIEGIRPVLSSRDAESKDEEPEEKSDLKYELSPGVFKKIVERARSDKKENYILIIDEINRCETDKIFGEIITLIEKSKRLAGDDEPGDDEAGDDEATVTLPYSKESFGIPNNLYIIGTMNTADRSIALLDTALRRRFDFIEMMPEPEHPEISKNVGGIVDDEFVQVECEKLLKVMNERIRVLHDRDHQIGHTYFFGVNNMDSLAKKFKNQIIPLLQEYFYDNWEKIDLVLNKNGFIQKDDVDVSFLKGSDFYEDPERKLYKLLGAEDDKWENPKSYTDIYKSTTESTSKAQDNQAA